MSTCRQRVCLVGEIINRRLESCRESSLALLYTSPLEFRVSFRKVRRNGSRKISSCRRWLHSGPGILTFILACLRAVVRVRRPTKSKTEEPTAIRRSTHRPRSVTSDIWGQAGGFRTGEGDGRRSFHQSTTRSGFAGCRLSDCQAQEITDSRTSYARDHRTVHPAETGGGSVTGTGRVS